MAATLILVPTTLELRTLEPLLLRAVQEARGGIERCGFGAIAAAARTSQLLARHDPARVILVGIAGAVGNRLTVGQAYEFSEVACYGIGVGTGASHSGTAEMGFRQWEDAAGGAEIGDVISLSASDVGAARQLLTACAASGGEEDVRLRQQKLPDACAEDMEGFAVAVACQLAGVPLQIVRGISNVAGNRDKRQWKIDESLQAAAGLVISLLALHASGRT